MRPTHFTGVSERMPVTGARTFPEVFHMGVTEPGLAQPSCKSYFREKTKICCGSGSIQKCYSGSVPTVCNYVYPMACNRFENEKQLKQLFQVCLFHKKRFKIL
jgi:hypothetical protein